MALQLDHDEEGEVVAAALEGFKTEPLAGVRLRATVRILGEVEAPPTPLIAPISGVPCVKYDIVFLDGPLRGVVLARATSAAVFTIVDPSGGRAVVDPAHAQVRIQAPGASIRRDDERAADVEALAGRARSWVRAREVVVVPGDHVVIVAAAMEELDRDDDRRIGTYRGLAPTRIRLGGTEQYPVMISTHPKDLEASRDHLANRW